MGVKSSQIESGSRYVSKISIQKAKMRQKQMVQAVISGSNTGAGAGKVVDQAAKQAGVKKQEAGHRRQTSAIPFDHSRNQASATATVSGGNPQLAQQQQTATGRKATASTQLQELSNSAGRKGLDKGQGKVIVKKIGAAASKQQSGQTGTNNATQIEQVEQFYAMLSGL